MISPAKKRELKSQSQLIKPVVLLGANGLTDSVHKEIERALNAHELVKIKLSSKDKSEKDDLAQAICDQHDAELIAQIGHVITVYRKNDSI